MGNRSVLFLVVVLLTWIGGCGGEDSLSSGVASMESGAYVQSCDAGSREEVVKSSLCMVSRSSSEGDIVLQKWSPDEECPDAPANGVDSSFVVTEDRPQAVRLYGEPRVRYCVGVVRLGGYITISHETGEVTREQGSFTWCVRPRNTQAEQMFVRSLTARAEFRLVMP